METKRPSKPTSSAPSPSFSGHIEVKDYDPTSPDARATEYLLGLYTEKDGFHCPVCKVVIPDTTEAVYHLADELNKALANLPKGQK